MNTTKRSTITILLGLLLSAAPAWADGTFCWDPLPVIYPVDYYRIYHSVPLIDPSNPAPPLVEPWHCSANFDPIDVCDADTCCAFVTDEPDDLVFYIITARILPNLESDGEHGPKNPVCDLP